MFSTSRLPPSPLICQQTPWFCYPLRCGPNPSPSTSQPTPLQCICHQNTTNTEIWTSESIPLLFRIVQWLSMEALRAEPHEWPKGSMCFVQLWTPHPPSASVCATLPHHLSVLVPVSQKPGKLVPARGLCPGTSLPGMLSPRSLLGWLSLQSLLKTSPSLRSLLTTQLKAREAWLVTTFEQTKFKLYSWSSDSTDQNTQYDHNMWGK